MKNTRIVHVSAFLDGAPDSVRVDHYDGQPVLQVGDALTLHLEHATPELLFRIASVLADTAAEKQVALSVKAVAA
ncbi:hypothetical protein [Streptomyces sp. NPDC055243]|uniref:hypothetical protein n=1 Tax=Streptomyces sp. NPDC055243 TaxID=3365720 RepID=UPI0037D434F8